MADSVDARDLEVLTVAEAADRLRVSVWTIRRWCDDGTLDHFRLPGGHRRIPATAIDAIVKGTAA